MTEQSIDVGPPVSGAGVADRGSTWRQLRPMLAALALAVAALVAGIIAWPVDGLAVRFFRFDVIPLAVAPLLWTAAVVLFVVFPPRRPAYLKWMWRTSAAVLTLITVPVWVWTALVMSLSPHTGKTAMVEVSPDGRHEAVAVSYSAFDSGCRVWLRERGGLFSRQSLVWEETEGYCPVRVSFSDDTTISVTDSSGRRTMTTTFDPERTQVDALLRS
ncbi:hypothetical protein [Nocardia brasiliensis]|uniref:hypothetical protein n=1 Tax=Nocardia brasiliensis TaxID=37326 RepID=UPI002457389B|nr:hypothetical protein [Nocardia brasiliensis]